MNTNLELTEAENQAIDNGLHRLFLDQLAEVYHAEQQLTQALPELVRAARSPDLRSALETQLAETKNHISHLNEVFLSLNERLDDLEDDGRETDAPPVWNDTLIIPGPGAGKTPATTVGADAHRS